VEAAGAHTLSATFTPTDTTDYNTASGSVTLSVNKATPSISWATPAAITYGAALSATQLNASSGGVAGTFVYSPASGTVETAGTHTLSVTFTPTDTADYNSATASVTLTVNKAAPTVSTWPTASAITYGQTLASSTLSGGSGSVGGSFAFTTPGTVPGVGTALQGVTFTPTDTADYNSATGSASVTVNKSTPTITWSTPAAITYGTALSSTQLNASSGGVAGTFAYSPASGTVEAAGAHTLSATFTPTNTTDYNSASGSVTLTVNKATPAITWPIPAAITYGTPLSATQLDAIASVPGTWVAGTYVPVAGTFSYSPASGAVLTAGSQTLIATFTPTDTTAFTAANTAITLTVNKVKPTVIWPMPANVIPGTALSSLQLDASANVPGTFAYSPVAGTVMATGSQILALTFTATDTTDYNTVTVTVPLTVSLTPSAGIITTVAGNGTEGYSGDGGSAINAELNKPSSIGVDAAGNLFIADTYNQRVRKVNASSGNITTVAGNGTAGYTGDGGSATSAEVYYPANIAVDGPGNIYVADNLHARIRKVPISTGTISTVAGNGTSGYTGDGGAATSAEINPGGIWIDAADNIYFVNPVYNSGPNTWSYYYRKVTASTGAITTIATVGTGSTQGPVDSAGNIYFISGNNIKKLTASTGTISTVAGNGTAGYTGDGGRASSAEIQTGNGFDVDAAGNIYILSYQGSISTIRKVTASTGIINTVIGGVSGCSQQSDNVGDGCPAVDGVLSTPYGVAADTNGNIYVADYWGQRIRAAGATITPTVNVSCSPNPITFGGSSSQCAVSVGGGATGTVTLTYNGSTWTTVTLSAGAATATWPSTTGGGTFLIVATYNGDASHSAALGTTSLIVTQLSPNIIWLSPAPILYGTQLSATQLDASANVPGSFAYSPAAGATLPLGINTLTVTFTPQNSGYSTTTATTPLIVNSVETTLPTITSILPNPAAIGTTVTVAGDLFGATQGTSTVTFNGVVGTVTSWTNNAIAVQVPAGAKTGPVVVNVNGSTTNSFLLMVPVSCGH
jgi:hypothetical protein